MKNILGFIVLLISGMVQLCFAQIHAAELKKSCIKSYPQAKNDTDLTVIDLYQRLCDKPAKKSIQFQQQLSTQIAKRYIEVGNHLKALNLIEQLNQQNYTHQDLTDLKFLAGIGISSQSLEQMRSTEVRALNNSTYPQAKLLTEHIYLAQPVAKFSESALTMAMNSREKKAKSKPNSPIKRNLSQNKTSNSNLKKNTAVSSSKKTESISTRTHSPSTNPFGSLNNN
ncbi:MULTISPECIES: hypothetical protein [unclassified Acinetobacter]|uniref:hypothetical protein n=1 Tax=unclassified Acinetobacter TaxID=196816 RepID=UPI001C24DBEA|nr:MULTISPECIES: hypothetical protein [unclassified Acinetobacter]